MCGFVCEVLNTIKDPLVCTIDGVSKEFEDGSMAVEGLTENIKITHSIESIGIKGGKICVTVVDRQQEIEKNNRKWMVEEEKRTGVAPSFF